MFTCLSTPMFFIIIIPVINIPVIYPIVPVIPSVFFFFLYLGSFPLQLIIFVCHFYSCIYQTFTAGI